MGNANKGKDLSLTSLISQYNLPETVTYRLFPQAKNKILVRFDNLYDIIDANSDNAAETHHINIEQFADDLYFDENGMHASNYEIQEMSLQGVHPLDDEKRLQWTTAEDKVAEHHVLAQDENGFKGIALEPQRLRTFQITYNQPTESLRAQID